METTVTYDEMLERIERLIESGESCTVVYADGREVSASGEELRIAIVEILLAGLKD
jgi:hypothetical protein